MSADIFQFPGATPARGRTNAAAPEPDETFHTADWRSREHVQADINKHREKRDAMVGRAVAWEAAARERNLPEATIEEAYPLRLAAHNELEYPGRHLLICMPTDRRALVDLLLYLEKNFTILPQEMCGQLAGVRPVANHEALAPQDRGLRQARADIVKRRHRSTRKRNRQRLAAHARRLRR
jgi:hypothetical protein